MEILFSDDFLGLQKSYYSYESTGVGRQNPNSEKAKQDVDILTTYKICHILSNGPKRIPTSASLKRMS